ncbi:MAG TPA: hypothetical protein DDY31_17725 [Lachnospiraceae bacterium]|nr:hypothetical protein [Lachnospiraceae bacterium]
MGEIRESLVLEDRFSSSFSRFLQMGEMGVANMDKLSDSSIGFANSTSLANKELDSMRNILASQQAIHEAQIQKLHNQGEKVARLAEKHQDLANTKGNEAAATLRASQALARAQIAEEKILQESIKTERAILKQDEAIQRFTKNMDSAANATRLADSEQKNLKKSTDRTGDSAQRLLTMAGRIAAAFGGIKIASGLIGLSDTMAQTQARLGMVINEVDSGLGNVKDLQDMIYQSANRTRGSYQETANAVSKLGLMASDAFGSSEEIVAFMEQINKQFKIAGTDASGVQAAMLQLTQAMGSGVLRGEEYNSVLEQAPNIIQTIADYMGVEKGELKDLAAEGRITADIIKAAMFSAADEIDSKFESLPMTYEDAWTMIKNAGVKAFDKVSDKLNDFLNSATGKKVINGITGGIHMLAGAASGAIDLLTTGANWVADNWDLVYPLLIAVGAGFAAAGVAGMVSGLATMAAWSPVTLTMLAIGAGVALLIFCLNQAGVSFEEMGGVVGGVLGALYSVFYTVIANWWNLTATFMEFFVNVSGNTKTAVANLFLDLFDNIMDVVETAAKAIDALLGSNLSGAVSGFRDNISDWVSSKYGENEIQMKRMGPTDIVGNITEASRKGRDFGKKLDELNFNFDDFANSFGNGIEISGFGSGLGDLNIGKVGSVGNVKNVEAEISLSDEDLKLYRDLAERRYMNQIELKTLAPNINVTLPANASGHLSPDDVANHIKKVLIEQMSSHTAIAHG